MAAPNIVNSATISGDTDLAAGTTSLTAITTNSAASGQVYKINSLIACNIQTANTELVTTVDVTINRSATDYHIAKEIRVPVGATLVVISKDMGIYLTESDVIKVKASGTSEIDFSCSYEIIED